MNRKALFWIEFQSITYWFANRQCELSYFVCVLIWTLTSFDHFILYFCLAYLETHFDFRLWHSFWFLSFVLPFYFFQSDEMFQEQMAELDRGLTELIAVTLKKIREKCTVVDHVLDDKNSKFEEYFLTSAKNRYKFPIFLKRELYEKFELNWVLLFAFPLFFFFFHFKD